MFLSRVKLNTQKKATQMALALPNRIHGAVEAAFPERHERKLWRIDTLFGERYLMILSPGTPDLSNIQKQFGYDDVPGETRDYTPLLNRVIDGSRWQFRLVANPTFAKAQAEGRGQVHAHVSDRYLTMWLFKKAAANGFSVSPLKNTVECGILADAATFAITEKRWISFKKKDGSLVRFKAVSFEGMLTVTDADKMRSALTRGIGREKAYGMGLLTLMQVRDA